MAATKAAPVVSDVPPWEKDDGGFTLTFKAGKGYEDTWLVIRDATMGGLRRKLIEAFNWEEEKIAGLTFVQLVDQATFQFHTPGTLRHEFPATTAVPSQEGVWDGLVPNGAPAQEPDPNAAILARIEEATHPDQLRRMFAEEGPFEGDVLAAWKAKGKTLSGK